MEYYSAIKKEDILSFAGKWIELENIKYNAAIKTSLLKPHQRLQNII